MNEELPPDEGPVTDPQELDRVMMLAMDDVALMGPLMRLLMGARLWVYVPPHPELEGEHVLDVADGFTWNMYRDREGDYAAVFTSLRAAKDKRRSHLWLADGPPAMAEIPAKVLFHFFNNGRTHVKVTAYNCACIRLEPLAVEKLVAGEFTEQQPPPPPELGTGGTMILVPVDPDDVPLKLRQAIRVFCTQRQGAVAVYVCHPQDEATGRVDELDLRVLLRLRDNPGHFYNDFQIVVQKNTPKPYETLVGVPPAGQWEEPQMEFLRQAAPVWPVIRGR